MGFPADSRVFASFLGCKSLQHFFASPYFCALSSYDRCASEDTHRGSNLPRITCQGIGSEIMRPLLTSVCHLPGVTLLTCLSTLPLSVCPKPDYQLQFTFRSSGMKTLRAFLIMGCGFSSSSENLRLRGSNISWPGMLERARSAGSGSYPTGTWMVSGSMGLGVLRFAGNSWPGITQGF